MAYVCLFRQYRPQRFEDVHGQEQVTRTLQNAIRMNRTAQAYLFTGPRGVGKTSVARILAKALNCAEGPTAEPCGQCDSCRRIASGASLSVIEIDAASHRSIDDIRSLREDVQFAPTDGRYKIYILDEAHQITGPAFEAFLKTLEEPPPHAIFVLATTEVHKIPATILSRCQRFDFRRVGLEAIVERLGQVAQQEGLEVEPAARYAVAQAADGSLRDALSILDQVIAYSGERVTAADAQAVLGTLDADSRLALGDAVAGRDVEAALAWLGELLEAGRDPSVIIAEALDHFRLLLLARLRVTPEQLASLPAPVRERIEDQAQRFEPARLSAIMETWAACDKDLRWHPQPRILVELALIELTLGLERVTTAPPPAPREASPDPAPPRAERAREPDSRAREPDSRAREPEPRDTESRPREPEPRSRDAESRPRARREARPAEAAPAVVAEREEPPAARPSAPEPQADPAPEPEAGPGPLDEGADLDLAAVQARLPLFRQHLRQGWPPLMAHLVHADVVGVDGDAVVFGFRGWQASLQLCLQPDRRGIIEDVLSKVLGRPVTFRGELIDDSGPRDEGAREPVDLDQAVATAMDVFPGSETVRE